MKNLYKNIEKAKSFIEANINKTPDFAIILGTGLGKLIDYLDIEIIIDYSSIPGFVNSTVESHEGKLIFGKLAGKFIVVMQGRFHYYEGYSMREITFPIRLFNVLGIKNLIVSNAAGGLNPIFNVSDVMLINDIITLFMPNPLIGKHYTKFGDRFPDMSVVFDKELLSLAKQAAIDNKIAVREGVYVGVTGPSLETKAEYRLLRNLGADAVGMSTVPEVIVAVQSGMRILGITVITDLCLADALKPLSIEEVIENASIAEPKMVTIIKEVIEKFGDKNE